MVTKIFRTKINEQLLVLLLGALALGFYGCLWFWKPEFASIPLIVAIVLSAGPLLFRILKKLYQKDFGADILAALSIIAAFLLQEYLACLLIILMLASGQALENFAMAKASSVLSLLAKRMPDRCRRIREGHLESIELKDIEPGDIIIIAPHETSPVDGTVIEGNGFMDESYLTGEPYQIAKAKGSTVLSGAINGETKLLIRADKQAKDSRYAQIMKVMEDAEQKRPKMRRLADQLGIIFAPISLSIALIAWFLSSDPLRFLSVLVIATPCPLLIAIPVAIVSAISMAARRGIIITDPTVLELLPTCKTAIFDKTGTLTFGFPKLIEIELGKGFNEDEVLEKAASLEYYSKHPLAKAIINKAKTRKLPVRYVQTVTEKPGKALTGTIDQSTITIAGREQIAKTHPTLSPLLPEIKAGLECIVLINDCYAATFRFRDAPRRDSKSFIHHLGPFHAFNKVMLVSGDRESEVLYFAKQMGIEKTLASQSPEQKFLLVEAETKKAPTLFMGDGINDAPALKAATVGVAFGDPSNIARLAAGAVIMETTLSKADELLHLSKDMRTIALESALLGMGLSFIGMGFASFGFLSPVAGAILQQVIDALAILNALRLAWQKEVKIDLE